MLKLAAFSLAISLLNLASATSRADEFEDLSDSFGTTLNVAGVHHATTTNPDGSAINFWTESSEGAPAIFVGLSNPHMAAADAYGNIYIADKASHAILKVTTDGGIHTFAGTHADGFNGDGPADATTLQISNPNGLYVFPSGVVYLLDPGNHRIRRVGLDRRMTTVVNDSDSNWKASGRALWVSYDEKLIYYTHEYPPVPPSVIADGAVLKSWTPTSGIQTICSKAVGFSNPANIDINPADGKLYITDRGEEDTTKLAMGLFRIDGIDQRTRMTGNANDPLPADGQSALHSFIQEPRGIAFRPDGSYFICGHKDGSVWFVDTAGLLHRYLSGAPKKDAYSLPDGRHPPLTDVTYFAQPRAVTLAPNGNLIVVCNDSGYVFSVLNVVPSSATNLSLNYNAVTGIDIDWAGTTGRGYRVEQSLDLLNWDPIGATGTTLTGAAQFHQPAAPASNLFYRILPSL